MKKFLIISLLLLISGCSGFHVSHIPIIGWRIDIARQRESMRNKRIDRQRLEDIEFKARLKNNEEYYNKYRKEHWSKDKLEEWKKSHGQNR